MQASGDPEIQLTPTITRFAIIRTVKHRRNLKQNLPVKNDKKIIKIIFDMEIPQHSHQNGCQVFKAFTLQERYIQVTLSYFSVMHSLKYCLVVNVIFSIDTIYYPALLKVCF